ncbi:ABC transporter ATP-binding protein [Shinella sp. NM-101]|uniref:ABC transporter ATP-binding protein n=1 Tax=Shinella sp. NM-101 TaxID=2744455 RepID=UPI001F490535|nr:ABC transporter ATP-binding protein [Shinella sp. NM-101]
MTAPPKQSVLSVADVSVRFGGLTAVSGASFDLNAGEICALIGPNGAGKSTLFNAITGFARTASGRVFFGASDITGKRPDAIARLGVRRTFQNGGVLKKLSALENILTGLHCETERRIIGNILRLPSAVAEERSSIARAEEVLHDLGIAHLRNVKAEDLSSGQQRLVEIGRTLAQHSRLILLDEPAVGLSATDRANLGALLKRLAAGGVAILLVEHVLELVMAVSDRIVVLNHGQMIASGTPEAVRNDPVVLEAYLGNK